jgi:multiple sugar transport system substrate-binding protein
MKKVLTRRDFLRTAGAGLTGAALLGAAGCSGDDGQNSGGRVTLNFWHYYGTPDMPTGKPLQDLFDRYTEANPSVTIANRFVPFAEFNRTLLQSASGGDLPDIALVNAFDTQTFAEAGILQDLTDRVDSWGKGDAYFETSWNTTLWQRKNYGLPHVADCYVFYYDRDLFDEAGVEPPDTWDELEATTEKLSGGNRYGLAVSAIEGVEGATAWVIRFVASGGDVTNVDSPAGREALHQWVDLVKSGAMSRGILGWGEEDVKNQFANGQAAMMVNSATYVNILKDEVPDLNWKVALLPKAQERATFLAAENLTITTGSQNADAAWDLLTYMQKPDVLNEYLPERNKLPARKDVASKPPWSNDPVWSVFVNQLPAAWAPEGQVASKSAEIFTHIQKAIQAAVSGDSSVEAALARAQEKIGSVLQE